MIDEKKEQLIKKINDLILNNNLVDLKNIIDFSESQGYFILNKSFLGLACHYGHQKIIQYFLSLPAFNDDTLKKNCLNTVPVHDNPKLFDLFVNSLSNSIFSQTDADSLLSSCVYFNSDKLLKHILKHPKFQGLDFSYGITQGISHHFSRVQADDSNFKNLHFFQNKLLQPYIDIKYPHFLYKLGAANDWGTLKEIIKNIPPIKLKNELTSVLLLAAQKNNEDIIKYLIFEYKMIQPNKNKIAEHDTIKKMFLMRKLEQKIPKSKLQIQKGNKI